MKCQLLNKKQVVLNLCKVTMAEMVPSPSSVSSFEKNILTFHKWTTVDLVNYKISFIELECKFRSTIWVYSQNCEKQLLALFDVCVSVHHIWKWRGAPTWCRNLFIILNDSRIQTYTQCTILRTDSSGPQPQHIVLNTICSNTQLTYSWRWAYGCPKHVELFKIINKFVQVGTPHHISFILSARSNNLAPTWPGGGGWTHSLRRHAPDLQPTTTLDSTPYCCNHSLTYLKMGKRLPKTCWLIQRPIKLLLLHLVGHFINSKFSSIDVSAEYWIYSGRSRYQTKNCGREPSKSQSNLKFDRGSGGGWATHFADHQVTLQKQP
jgi:hypothetical protein